MSPLSSNSYLTLQPQGWPEQVQLNQLNKPEYDSDFSDRFEKSKNKLIYATIFSITIGLYSLAESSTFLGLKLTGLSDRRLEWMAWLGAIFFFLNTMLRYFDERRTAEKYKNEVTKLVDEFSLILGNLRNITYDIQRELSASGKFEADLRRMKEKFSRHQESLAKHIEPEESEKYFAEFLYSLGEIKNRIEVIGRNNTGALYEIRNLPQVIENFQKKVKPVKKYRNIGGIRFLIFDFFLPVGLFIFATTIHFFPGLKNIILDIIPL